MTERRSVAAIQVGDRRRTDMGDIDALARSMERFGLIHPIVIDEGGMLVAGGRRLEAAKLLRWAEIDCRPFGGLSDPERREIELEENLQRKDLTAFERNRTLTTLAETAAEVLRQEAARSAKSLPGFGSKSRGQQPKPDSEQHIAERIGVPQQTINLARQHVAAVVAHPVLIDAPQSVAIDYAKAVKDRPQLAGAPVGDVVELRRAERAMETPGGESEADKQARYLATLERVVGPDPEREQRELLARLAAFLRDAAKLQSLAPETFLPAMGDGERSVVRSHIVGTRRWCDRWELALDEAGRSGLRLVGDIR